MIREIAAVLAAALVWAAGAPGLCAYAGGAEAIAAEDGAADVDGRTDAGEETAADGGDASGDAEEAEPYDVTTLLATAQFASRPRIAVYNYILGDSVCKMAEYDWEGEDGSALLITLTPDEALTEALEGADQEDMAAMLRLAMGALESLGFVLDAGDETELYGRPCYTFAAYTDSEAYAGWAVMDARQVQFVLASGSEAGQEFLSTVMTRRGLEFTVEGDSASFGGVTLNFPYSVSVEGGRAECLNALTYERAELIQLPDIERLTGASDDSELLNEYVPEGAADVSTQTLGEVLTMLYVYDDAELGEPVQGRLILLDGCILRMEATFDNAGDAFMNDVFVEVG